MTTLPALEEAHRQLEKWAETFIQYCKTIMAWSDDASRP